MTPEKQQDEFYVGYEQEAPLGVGRLLRRVALLLLVLVILVSILLVLAQRTLPAAFFEYGQQREFEGVIRERPIPALIVERPNAEGAVPSVSRYTLVGERKHGLQAHLIGFEGRRVKLRGTLVYRDGLTMIEVAEGTLEIVPADAQPRSQVKSDFVGMQTLTGEIVDSKCYLGVMNPGSRTTHRECAVRCISGGVPPLFVVENERGDRAALWLITQDGVGVGAEVIDLVAKPVEITGEVTREGDQLYLRANPRMYRLPPRDLTTTPR